MRRSFTAWQIGRSTGYFPLVGLAIGLVLAGLNYALSLVLPASAVNALLIVAMAVLSGVLHLDGVVDTCDGLAGHGTNEQRLERMRDSRAGGFGVIGVALLLLVKYAALNSVPQGTMTFTLLLAPAVSRWAMVYAVFAFPYARPSGLGSAFKQATGWRQLLMATVIAAAVAAWLFMFKGLAVLLIVWILTLAIGLYLKRKLGGLTGDTYGAINEVIEVCVFIIVGTLVYRL